VASAANLRRFLLALIRIAAGLHLECDQHAEHHRDEAHHFAALP